MKQEKWTLIDSIVVGLAASTFFFICGLIMGLMLR